MTETAKQKFLVLYLIPTAIIDDWMKTAEEIRKPAEEKMRADWGVWMQTHGKMILSSEAGGKTKRVSQSGVSDFRNEIMLTSVIEADSHEAAAKAFESHPHLTIPQSSIEVMAIRPM